MFDYAIAAIQGARSYQEDASKLWIAPQFIHDSAADGGVDRGCVRSLASATEALADAEAHAVFVLADGMGGHAGGAQASQTACAVFTKAFASSASKTIDKRLSFGLLTANAAIAASVDTDPALSGMGCTLVGVALGPLGVQWISVGDSPLYLYRAGALEQLNEDHSMAPILDKMVQRGELSAQEARSDRRRNFLRSAVSGGEIELTDRSQSPLILQPGDLLIIASDGIQTLDHAAIGQRIASCAPADPQALAVDLVAAVEAAGHPYQDNMTVIVIRALGDVAGAAQR